MYMIPIILHNYKAAAVPLNANLHATQPSTHSYYYNDGLGRDACGCLASGAAFLMGLSGSLVALLDTS